MKTDLKIMKESEFNNYYKKYYIRLLNTSHRILSNRELAQEIVNDTMMKLLTKEASSLSEEQIGAWLSRVCVNSSIDQIRKGKKDAMKFSEYEATEIETAENEECWSGFLSSTEDKSEIVAQIKRGMAKLPEGYRVILSLTLFEGYDYEEIAQILGVRNSSVRSQYTRAKVKLLEILQNG